MSDRDPPHDPIGRAPDEVDAAYVRAETLLNDDDARVARRARLLAAVAREPAAPAIAGFAPASPPARPSIWRQGGWLAAAGVAGLSVFVATQLYPPIQNRQPIAPNPVAAGTPPISATAAAAPPPAPALSAAAAARVAPAARGVEAPAPAPLDVAPPVASPPPIMAPAAAPPPPPPPPPGPTVAGSLSNAPAAQVMAPGPAVAGNRSESADVQRLKAPAEPRAAAPALGFSRAGAAFSKPALSDRPAPDGEARLRAAAAAGRTTEVEALLAQGVLVDAPDSEGETALMESIQADHPAVAAVLLRHGASLARRNHAGERASDMARAKGDPDLDRALSPGP